MPPLLGLRGASSAQSFGIFSSATTSAGGWIGKFSVAGTTTLAGLAIDGSDNIYFAVQSSPDTALVKLNKLGVLQWQKTISGVVAASLSCDSAGNLSLVGGSGTVIRLSSSGVITWQQRISASNVSWNDVILVGTDSYLVGAFFSGGAAGAFYNFNSSGAISAQTRYGSSIPSNYESKGIAYGNFNIYVGFNILQGSLSTGYNSVLVNIVNSSGVPVAGRQLYYTTASRGLTFGGIAVSPSTDVYTCGGYASGSTALNQAFVAKYPSGLASYTWITSIAYPGGGGYARSIAAVPTSVLAGGGCYCCGQYAFPTSGSPTRMSVFYIDGSGSIQWSRYFSTGASGIANKIAVTSTGEAVVGGSDSNGTWISLIPVGAAGQGTYSVGGTSITFESDSTAISFISGPTTNGLTSPTVTLSSTTTTATNTISDGSRTWAYSNT